MSGPNDPVLNYQSPAQPDDMRWLTIWKGGNSVEANLLVTKLQAHGIHARVDMENAAGLGAYGGAIYGTKVHVLAGDADAAREILSEIDTRRARRLAAQSVTCPRCGEQNAKRVMHPIRWCGIGLIAIPLATIPFGNLISAYVGPEWIFLMLVLGTVLLVWWGVTPRWLCRSCGLAFAAKEPDAVEEEDEDEEDDDEGDDRAAGS